MKGLMGKFKGMPIKQILLNHAEKIVLSFAGLVVLIALVSTTWAGIDKQPEALMENATKAGQALHTGAWPQEEQAKFADSTYAVVAANMMTKLADSFGRVSPQFAYDKPMSFPLYKRIEPKTEVTWPQVTMMIADAGEMIIAQEPELPMEEEVPAEGAEAPATPRKSPGPAKGHAAPMGPMSPMGPMAPGMMAGADGMTGGSTPSIKPRGIKYVAVRGIVDLDQFHKAIRDALRLDQLDEARSYLEFLDVKVQRQKAVAGDKPWLDSNWEDVDIAKADEIFKECQLAPDIVQLELTDPVITMSLPARLDRDYDNIVSHPFIKDFQLTKEQREQQEKIIRALQEEAGESGTGGQKPRRKGFSGITEDIRGLQQNFMSNNGDMNAVYSKAGVAGPGPRMGGGQMQMAQQQTLLPPTAAMAPGMAKGMGPAMGGMHGGPGMGMGMGMKPGLGAVQQVGGAAVGYVLLFRYLDFDVTPGEAYRYRMQLVVSNPNFGEQLDKVRNATDAEGETRDTPMSEPTAPVVIKSDTNIFLTKLDERPRTRGEADMKVFQWDPQLGTYIDGDIRVKPGQFVGGLGESERLDLATPSFDKKTVLFASKEFLLDTSIPSKLIPNEHPDLKLTTLDARQAASPYAYGAASEVLVMNEFGEVHLLDTESGKSDLAKVSKKVQDERKPWEALKEVEKTESRLDGAGPGMEMMMAPQMATGVSSTKKGSKGKQQTLLSPTAAGPGPVMKGGKKGKKGKDGESMHSGK